MRKKLFLLSMSNKYIYENLKTPKICVILRKYKVCILYITFYDRNNYKTKK